MTSTGTNHGCGPVMRQGQSRTQWSAGLMASGEGARRQRTPVQGRDGPGIGSRLRARLHRQWAALGLGSGGSD